MKPKKELIRVVRTPEGAIILDATGKANGRGGYVCRDPECLAQAYKRKGLNRALKVPVSEEIYAGLREEMGRIDG